MCIGMIGSMTACGNDNGTTDGADQDRTTQESASEKEKAAEKEKATEKTGQEMMPLMEQTETETV